MKQRFSSLDVKVIAHELSASLTSLRVSNIYDLSSRIFLFKFAKPEHREQLLVESGYRCHLSSFARSTAAAPSPFVTRLRKFLKTRRVTSVRQIGTDRVIEISFSDGLYHLLLEFYAGGNVILTDSEYNILALLRTVSEGADHEQFRVGARYELQYRQNYAGVPALTKERVAAGLRSAIEKAADAEAQNKKFKRKPGDALRRALAVSITEYPPILLEHALQKASFEKTTPPSEILSDDKLLDHLVLALEEARKTVEEIVSASVAKGYIISKTKSQDSSTVMYDDFHPFKPCQIEAQQDLSITEIEGFNKTADEFFSSIEGQKLESKLQERELNAKRKMDNARAEHDKRIDGLQQVQELNIQKAQALEANLDRVEEARAAVNGLIAQGMDWQDIDKLIEMEQSRNNAVAQTIKLPLKLHENTATLLLAGFGVDEEEEMADQFDSEASSDSDDEQSKPKKTVKDERIAVDIDLAQSAWANSRQYYDQKRVAASKQDRTVRSSVKALKSTEQKISADLKKGLQQEKAVLRPVRKQFWFEKFNWFVSSDGYLVLSGKDAQQTEILYRRHLKKGDVYVHADLQAAAVVIIKNNPETPDAPIPPSTLSQAGNYCVCTSSAWDSKAVMSAWWVAAEQVSKLAATGEYLAGSGFTIKGDKNFLPPAQLLLGFAVLFQVSEESKARHTKHRVAQADSVPAAAAEQMDKQPARTQDDEDDDDDFPDANAGLSDDDDFPDADNESVAEEEAHAKQATHSEVKPPANEPSDDESEDEDGDKRRDTKHNPLQPKKAPQKAAVAESSAASEDESADQSDADKEAEESVIVASNDDKPSAPSAKPQSKSKQAPKQQQPPAAKPTRGKRAKAKRAAKYADQSDEDRELALSLLGHRPAASTTNTPAPAKETADEARARRREQHAKTQAAGLAAEAERALTLHDDDEADDHSGPGLTDILTSLVPHALQGDDILEAIPVCAPWSSLARYKYKAKLQPGAIKKGKAVREVLYRWVKDGQDAKRLDPRAEDRERIWPREAELVRAWRDVEVMGVVPVKGVRVMMSGGPVGSKGGGGGKKVGKPGKGGKGGKRK